MSFTVVLAGRPNVGKSTLFNRLVGRRLALVDNTPGVTRDLREGQARLGHLQFVLTDTGGVSLAAGRGERDSLEARMSAMAEGAAARADLCLLVVDARAGITYEDAAIARRLRKRVRNLLLVANKCEGAVAEAWLTEAWGLGLGEPIAISAEHGEGMGELATQLAPFAMEDHPVGDGRGPDTGQRGTAAVSLAKPLQVAVLGRPNVGKSTLVNSILGHSRMLTGPEAGITRDAIAIEFDWNGTPVRLFDTAGIRRKARVGPGLEQTSVGDALRAIRFAEVAILLMDAKAPLEQQDLRLGSLCEREGRAFVAAINKWDIVGGNADQRETLLRQYQGDCHRLLPQLAGAPVLALSAARGRGLDALHSSVLSANEMWNRRVPTGVLNRWLADMVAAHPPPAPGGRRTRLRYLTQVRTRPPGFVLMCSSTRGLGDAYRRYLVNGLRRDFGLQGTPIRLMLRSAGRRTRSSG